MNELTVYVDEFGNITEKNPSKPWGSGCFACYDKDISFLNDKLKKCFSQKIHIRKLKLKEEVLNEIIKVSEFLKKCGKNFYAGGIGASKPNIIMEKIINEQDGSPIEIDKNYTLEESILNTLTFTSHQIACHHRKDTSIKLSFILKKWAIVKIIK